MNRQKAFAAALLGACLLCCAPPLLRAGSTASELDRAIIRLHIVGNSDSEEHQRQKLLVRDAVQDCVNLELRETGSRRQALALLEQRLPEIRAAAERALRADGSAHSVAAAIARRHFPLRTYGSLTIPAGRYTALTLTIGAGIGQNWWCVMFPPMCYAGELIEPAEGGGHPYEAYFSERLSKEALQVLHSGDEEIVYRFRVAEELEKLGNALEGWLETKQ